MIVGSTMGVLVATAGALAVLVVAAVIAARRKAMRLAPWKRLRNGMTPEEVRGLLGQPRQIVELEDEEAWEYGPKNSFRKASVLFTLGKVSGFVKPF